MDKLYNVINEKGEQVGFVTLEKDYRLKISNKGFVLILNDILEVFEYTTNNKLHLNDMQNDLYNLNIHNAIIEKINKIGIGYVLT